EVIKSLEESPLIAELRRKHDIEVVRFDTSENGVVTLAKIPGGVSAVTTAQAEEDKRSFYDRYWPARVIIGVAVLAVICLWRPPGLPLRVRAICTLPIVLGGVVVLLVWSANFTDLWSRTRVDASVANGQNGNGQNGNGQEADAKTAVREVKWREVLDI